MDSNHDIVPTLRLNGGVYMSFAADEIERLRARVALLERRADTSLIPGAEPTHRCKVCGAYWRKWNVDGESSWNLRSRGCGECCDNAAMGDQIEALASPAKVPDAVMQALDRMSTPLHDSRLSGLTAELDAANIKTIRDYVLSGAVPAKVVGDDQHPDDAAVDRFSVAMKAKLAKKRAQGRGGWDDERICSPDDLARMLVDHVRKGDPVDVGNLAMMLFNRPDAGAALCRATLSADGGEESPGLANPLTPYGMLVRALRITTATTLMDMARYRNVSPSLLSGMEFGRKPVTIDDAIAASEFFSEHGVAGTLGALTVALQAAIAANQAKGE